MPDQLPVFGPDAFGADAESRAAVDLATRGHQIFPVLSADDIRRVQRFGVPRRWHDGECVFHACGASPGMIVVLAGHLLCSRTDALGNRVEVVEYGPGQFSGEVAVLSGRPPLVDGVAVGVLEALAVDRESLHALLMAEAELGERLMRAFILRRVLLIGGHPGGPILIGPPAHAGLFELENFLSRNAYPYTRRDPASDPESAQLVREHWHDEADWPLVALPDGFVMRNPSLVELGRCLGTLPRIEHGKVFDVLVVGAGPAGLATAVYAASEGLSVLVLDQRAYGGQAGASARIENFLGFPTGISGRALAGRSYVQAIKFGAEIAIPAQATRLLCHERPLKVELADGSCLRARAVVLAAGARYRRPDMPDLGRWEGRGVYYWASPVEAGLCRKQPVLLVGGGNSAGQAAVFLSAHASQVHLVVRRAGLEETMSSYLIERIAAAPNIVLHTRLEPAGLEGDEGGLNKVRCRGIADGRMVEFETRHMFLFVGADPNSDWLGECGVALDDKGFVLTGREAGRDHHPRALETSVDGVFAVGDLRAGSTKRVAAAAGEGAAVVAQIHAYLAN
ncbi:thioredoxin reductase [Massilia sp. WF1]|uniref:FAD-dependent oxidoreductase n=1 Tax=unclassified Massilia TaxID=2609279 RepID=UPI00064A6C61|nr:MULTISPECIES: FAD-dependent oxidoreductase [unclassified Massilia]KLU37157.1 thioredoxin reductase [Massilia sp. WF1]